MMRLVPRQEIRIQERLDRFLNLDPISWRGGNPLTKKEWPRCPVCGKIYRSAPWIAKRRIRRHAKKAHKQNVPLSKIR